MTFVAEAANGLTRAAALTGAFAPLILFFASCIEYVFPPFPGDLVVLFGAWYAAHGELSWPATFLWVTLGALVGAAIDYRIGAWLAPRVNRRAAEGGHPFAEKLARFEVSYRRWGAWLLVFNRFMPGIRAFLFVAAGAAGIPLRRVLLLGGLSACAWNALLLAAGAFAARNVDELVLLFERYTNVAWSVLAAVALVLLARALVRHVRSRPSEVKP
ncbi:MAG TPA: DedA family protein [Anaeromyxobacteraceae bacterium]|nr:DedA family protein [Anaeromyxobacteraceae bacterium]